MKWVQRWWEETPRFVSAIDHARFQSAEDLSAGKWRERAFATPNEWPAVCVAFERSKFYAAMDDAILCKFAGLGAWLDGSGTIASAASNALEALPERGWSVPPRHFVDGFYEMPWIEGERLTAGHFALDSWRGLYPQIPQTSSRGSLVRATSIASS